jgi:hypothetical protein
MRYSRSIDTSRDSIDIELVYSKITIYITKNLDLKLY